MEMEMEGSLNLVLRYNSPPYFANIVKIDLNHLPENLTSIDGTYTGMPEMMETEMEFPHPPPIKYVARFKQGHEFVLALDWKVCSLAAAPPPPQTGGGCSIGITPADHHDYLCVFPDGGTGRYAEDNPLSGSIFNFRTGAIEKLKPFDTPKHLAYLVSLKGDIYSFSDPSYKSDSSDCVLSERYCVEKKCWEPLKPYPLDFPAALKGYAAFDDFIVFNMVNDYDFQMVAYDCSSGNWHEVAVENRDCYGFTGLGVVVKTSLYAFTPYNSSILELSITRDDDGGVGVAFRCCLGTEFDLFQINHPNLVVDEPTGSDHLVHLGCGGGGLDFGLVRTGYSNPDYGNQELKIMVLRLEESQKMATLIHVMDYKIKHGCYEIRHCFLLPPSSDLDLHASEEEDKTAEFAFDIRNANPAREAETARLNRERKAKAEWYRQNIRPPKIRGLGPDVNPALEAGTAGLERNDNPALEVETASGLNPELEPETDWYSQNIYPPEIAGVIQTRKTSSAFDYDEVVRVLKLENKNLSSQLEAMKKKVDWMEAKFCEKCKSYLKNNMVGVKKVEDREPEDHVHDMDVGVEKEQQAVSDKGKDIVEEIVTVDDGGNEVVDVGKRKGEKKKAKKKRATCEEKVDDVKNVKRNVRAQSRTRSGD